MVAAYAEMEGTETSEVRVMRSYWRTRYGDDYKELRIQNAIAHKWLDMKAQLSGLNSIIASQREELTKQQATIDFQRGEIRDAKTKAETAQQFARNALDEALTIRMEAAEMARKAEAKSKEAEDLMKQAMAMMAQTTENALKKGQANMSVIMDELRENMKSLFLKAKDGLHLKENMKQHALSLFSTMYDVLVEKKNTQMPMSKEDFMRLMCYIFGYEQKHPLQALNSLKQRGGEMQIFRMLTEEARGMSK